MNRETKIGLYIVGGIVVVLGFLAYGMFALLTQGVPTMARLERDRQFGDNGTANANLYVEGPFSNDYAASAVFELPAAPDGERDTPSVQLGFTQPYGSIQGGLIRAPQDKFALKAFAAYPNRNGQFHVEYLNRLADGPHRIELRVKDGIVMWFVDGAYRFETESGHGSPSNGNPWLFIGTSATFIGNSAYGTISDIRVRRDNDAALEPVRPTCNISNGGIHVMPYGDGWILSGTSMRSVPIDYHDCSDFFARHRALAKYAG